MVLDRLPGVGVLGDFEPGEDLPVLTVQAGGFAGCLKEVDQASLHLILGAAAEADAGQVLPLQRIGKAIEKELPIVRRAVEILPLLAYGHVGRPPFLADLAEDDGAVGSPGQLIGTTAITGSYTQNTGTLEIELGQDAADSLAVTGLATLGGTLELVSVGSRPREGQTFAVVTADGGFANDFSEVLSDIVNGIPEGLEAFSTAVNGTAYEVVFNGYTAGDANGDHRASIGDLALMAGNWNQAVTGGYADADFNGDGIVSIGDLSMLAGNWGWELPGGVAVPEPATLSLLAVGGLAVLRRHRRRPGRCSGRRSRRMGI